MEGANTVSKKMHNVEVTREAAWDSRTGQFQATSTWVRIVDLADQTRLYRILNSSKNVLRLVVEDPRRSVVVPAGNSADVLARTIQVRADVESETVSGFYTL